MKRLFLFLPILFSVFGIRAQSLHDANHFQKDFPVVLLKHTENPYEKVLPKSYNIPFYWNNAQPGSGSFQPVTETYDHWDDPTSSWIPNYRFEHTYYSTGKLATTEEYVYSSATQSILSLRSTYTYDDYGFLSEEMDAVLDPGSNQLVNQQRDEQQHEISGNPLLERISYWDPSQNDWLYNHKHEYSYDNLDRETLIMHFNYDEAPMTWSLYQEYSSLYDSSGNFTRYLGLSWNDSLFLWENLSKDTMEYDVNHHRIREELSIIPEGQTTLSPFIAYEYGYDAAGRLTEVITDFWNLTSQAFKHYDQTNYTFNDQGQLIKTTYQQWNAASSSWENNNSSDYIYDTNGLLTQQIISTWNGTSWAAGFQYLYSYDAAGNLIESLSQLWNSTEQSWVNDERYTAEYILATGVDSVFKNNFNPLVYPNPANDKIFIESLNPDDRIIILNSQGAIIAQFNSGSLDVSSLSAGMYTLYAEDHAGQFLFEKKLIIVR